MLSQATLAAAQAATDTARQAASGDARTLYDEAWIERLLAGRHALLATRQRRQAQGLKQTAASPRTKAADRQRFIAQAEVMLDRAKWNEAAAEQRSVIATEIETAARGTATAAAKPKTAAAAKPK